MRSSASRTTLGLACGLVIAVAANDAVAGPPNDNCVDSIIITNGPTAYSTLGATTDGVETPGDCGVFGDENVHNEIWFDYNADFTGTLQITTCEQLGGSADYDSRLAAYETCACPADNANFLGCNDDDPNNPCGKGGGGFHSTLEIPVVSGTCYKIRVGGFSDGDVGTGTLQLNTSGPPPVVGACCIVTDCSILTEPECLAQGGIYQGDRTMCGGGQTFPSFPAAPLLDDDPVGVSDTITVPDSFTITDLDVALQVTHTWVGDLCVTLVHQPTGTTVDLIQRMGAGGACHSGDPFGCATDNFNIALDDAGAGGLIEDQCMANLSSPPGYVPNNPLAAFNTLDSAGDWTLTVSDNAGGDFGTFDSWSLIFTSSGPGPCDSLCDWDLDGSGDVGILDLLALLAAWGANPGHPADFDGDGTVGILDLLTLLANWGPCP